MDPNLQQQPMNQPVQQATPVAPQPQPNQPQALGQFVCWTFPKGRTVFSAVKSNVVVYPGWVIVTDALSNQELMRMQLTPDLKISSIMGTASFTHLGGEKIGFMNSKMIFYFYNPMYNFISYWFGLFYGKKIKAFITTCKAAAGIQ